MKKILLLLLLFKLSGLFAQVTDFNSKMDDLIYHRTQIISIALSDSVFKEVKYVFYKYDAVMIITGMKISRPKFSKPRLFKKKEFLKIDTIIYNPFKDNDLDFYLYQTNDTVSLIQFTSDHKKSVVYLKTDDTYPIILMEMPLFSEDFQQAIIKTSISHKGGCVGYEFTYQFKNGVWIKKSEKMIYRC